MVESCELLGTIVVLLVEYFRDAVLEQLRTEGEKERVEHLNVSNMSPVVLLYCIIDPLGDLLRHVVEVDLFNNFLVFAFFFSDLAHLVLSFLFVDEHVGTLAVVTT